MAQPAWSNPNLRHTELQLQPGHDLNSKTHTNLQVSTQSGTVGWVMQCAAKFHRSVTYAVPGTDRALEAWGAELNLTSASAAVSTGCSHTNYNSEDSKRTSSGQKHKRADWRKTTVETLMPSADGCVQQQEVTVASCLHAMFSLFTVCVSILYSVQARFSEFSFASTVTPRPSAATLWDEKAQKM